MIQCIFQKLCAMIAILQEKYVQLCEVENQQELLCQKLDDIVGDETTECPECPPSENLDKQFRFFAFDEGNGFFNDPDYIMSVTVNGGTPTSQGPSASTNKSSNYTSAYAAINAVAGWGISVVNDVEETANGKVEHLVTYAGTGPATLQVVNNHTGDVFTFNVAEDGTCSGTAATSDGDPISSPVIEVI